MRILRGKQLRDKPGRAHGLEQYSAAHAFVHIRDSDRSCLDYQMPSPPKNCETSRRCTQRSLTWMSDTESVTFNLKLTSLRRPSKSIMVMALLLYLAIAMVAPYLDLYSIYYSQYNTV